MIGIFGGAFDPVHFGHLRSAVELLEKLNLEQIRFIPCRTPVHKDACVASPEQRLAMLYLATEHQPKFIVDAREIHRSSASYTIETLEDLHQEFPHKTFGLIIGSDALLQFTRWKDWQKILTLAKLIVMPRPGFSLDLCPIELKPFIIVQPITEIDISSTMIRENLKKRISVKESLPEAVFDYLTQEKIY